MVCVCEIVGDTDGCITLGAVEDLAPVYEAADLVINPVAFTSGLSIKTMEALGYSKAVVASPAGSRGLEEAAGRALLVAEDPSSIAESVIEVLSDPALSRMLSDAAFGFAEECNRRSRDALAGILD